MACVFIPTQMRDLTGGAARVEVAGHNLRAVLRQLDEQFPGIQGRILDGEGIRPGLQISIDGRLTSRSVLAPVAPQSEIHILPAIGGG